jgi:hypothetical protein
MLNRWLIFYNYQRKYSNTSYKSLYKNLNNKGINVDEIFWFKEPHTGNIFIGLNQMETSSAKE